MKPLRFSLLSVFLATSVIALICAVARLYAIAFHNEPIGGAWLFAISTFLMGMAGVSLGSTWLAFRKNHRTAQGLVRMGGLLMASSVPLVSVLALVFGVIDRFVRAK
jgi:hypothetical protein